MMAGCWALMVFSRRRCRSDTSGLRVVAQGFTLIVPVSPRRSTVVAMLVRALRPGPTTRIDCLPSRWPPRSHGDDMCWGPPRLRRSMIDGVGKVVLGTRGGPADDDDRRLGRAPTADHVRLCR